MREKIIAGNWKMHKSLQEGIKLAEEIITNIQNLDLKNNKVIFCTPFIHLPLLKKIIQTKGVYFGAQNCFYKNEGAYTGEISPEQIKSTGAGYVIIGHSERRAYFGEKNEVLAAKTDAALSSELKVIFCCGETQTQRDQEKHFTIVSNQIAEGLFHLDNNKFKKIIIAYEPVWAIGTGKTATPDDAQEMHKFIRSIITKKYGNEVADEVIILYGGSMKPGNAYEILSMPDIDGGLIGGASLKADDFTAIINAALK